MAFKVVANPEFLHEVEISVPVDGGFSKEKLSTRFKVLAITEIDSFDLANLESQSVFLDRIVVNFEDLVDDKGKALPCTPQLRSELLALPYIRMAVMAEYRAALSGAARKN